MSKIVIKWLAVSLKLLIYYILYWLLSYIYLYSNLTKFYVQQLQKLNDLIQKPIEQSQSSSQVKEANSMESASENGGRIKCEAEVKPSPSMERSEHVLDVLSDDDTSIKVEYFGLEDETGLMNFAEHADGSLTSPEDWSAFESNDLLGQSSCDYQWWDFWS